MGLFKYRDRRVPLLQFQIKSSDSASVATISVNTEQVWAGRWSRQSVLADTSSRICLHQAVLLGSKEILQFLSNNSSCIVCSVFLNKIIKN